MAAMICSLPHDSEGIVQFVQFLCDNTYR